jgi:hypothetical protein
MSSIFIIIHHYWALSRLVHGGIDRADRQIADATRR